MSNLVNCKRWMSKFFVGLILVLVTFIYGCSSVTDPETMKKSCTHKQHAQHNNDQTQPQKTADSQKSTSGRVLAAGSHITGAMFGG